MVHNIFYHSKTAEKDINITNIREIYGCIEYQCTLFIAFNSSLHC